MIMTFYAFNRHLDAEFRSKKIFFLEYFISMRLLYTSKEIRVSLVLPLRGEIVAAGILEHCFTEKLSSNILLKDCQVHVIADCYYLFWFQINSKAVHVMLASGLSSTGMACPGQIWRPK